MLNTSKTVALTTEAQPPSFIQVGDSHMIKVLGQTESHKWLGCMLCACPGLDSDVEYHLQQAATAFQKHRWMLQCKECSIKHRLRYFEAIVSSTACFAAEHRPLYRKYLQKYDVHFRKFIRQIVGPPPGTNWSAQWHGILHEWNLRVDHWTRASGISSWSRRCMIQYWKFASYIANLPAERWVRRALAWNPLPTYRSRGRRQTHLGYKTGNVLEVQSFGRLGNCCEKCGAMGCFASDFPTFLFNENAAATFSEKRLQLVQLACTYIYFFFASALTLGSPTGVGADLT